MGGSSKQVTGYQYFANFLLFIGNPIEKLLGINFDKRGWINPLVDENGNALTIGTVNNPSLYGENEGGVVGQIHARYGATNPEPVSFYANYLADNDLPPLAYPYQSYLAFTGISFSENSSPLDLLSGNYGGGFYLGNSGYMKEMLLWPKRIHVKNDGTGQWFNSFAEVPELTIPVGGGSSDQVTLSSKWVRHEGNGTTTVMSEDHQTGYGINFQLTQNPAGSHPKVIVEYHFNIPVKGEINLEYSLEYNAKLISKTGQPIVSIEDFIENGTQKRRIIYKLSGDLNFNFEIEYTAPDISTFTVDVSAIPAIEKATWLYEYNVGDMNPIHKIREILTDDTAMNKPESQVNDENFMKAAIKVWEECLGISWAITEKSCIEAINELCAHIEAGVRINRQTGLYEMVLFRDDWFEDDEIHTLAESNIKSISFEVQNADEVVNQLNVSYYDRENIKDASFSISENASIKNMNGRVNAEAADFPYFMNQRNAAVVAQWKLKQMTAPCWKGSFTTGFYAARKWNRYDIVKLNWSRKGIVDLPVRIMSINLGDGVDNTVRIDFVEVVPFSDELTSTVVIDDKIDVTPLPPLPCQYEPFEFPYYFAVMALGQRKTDDELAYDHDFGLVGVVAERPQTNSLYAVMMTNNGDAWERAGSIQYSETADLDQIISRTSSSFTVKNWKKVADVPVGTLIKCGSDWIGTSGEWMVFQGVDPYTGVVSVKRGALDSVPQHWGVDTKLYFCSDDVAYDPTEYIAGEEVLVSALTTTPSGMLENLGSIQIDMKARAIRPYPPANVKFNGVYYPESLIVTNDISLTWVDRNRVQQTGGSIFGFYDAGVSKETGVTYSYELKANNATLAFGSNLTVNTVSIPHSVLIANKAHTLKLWAERDGFSSYQIFEHAFFVEAASLILTATVTKSQVSGNTVPDANITVNVDETLQANMKFDGSSISGHAQAGATITIEIEE